MLLTHLRAEARRRWPAWLAVVALVGVVGGLVLGSPAGSRRTHTAYDRLVADTEAWDVLVNPDAGVESALDPAEVAALPQVAELGMVDGVGAVLVQDGEPALGSGPLTLAAGDRSVLVDFARLAIVEGEQFDPADPTHVMVDDVVAERYGVEAGDRVEIATATFEELIAWEPAGAGPAALDGALDAVLAGQQAGVDTEQIEVFRTPARPADVQSLSRVRGTPLIIAAVLAVLGGAAFPFVLVSGVRSRRHETAILKTFGFRSRGVAGTVAWQATTTAVVAGVIGIFLAAARPRPATMLRAE